MAALAQSDLQRPETYKSSIPHRELALAEAQAAAEEEALANGEPIDGLDDPDDDLAHNLDDDVPDADEGEGGWIDDDEVDEEDIPIDEQALAEMNDDGGEGDYADQPDLDDDVPEAGSYQHTDTEVEDDSSLEGDVAGARRVVEEADAVGQMELEGLRLRGRERGSGVLGSSVFGSSPVVQMSYQGGRSGSGRGRGREN